MTKQASIQYISSLINEPAEITEGDQSSIALLRQTYPYFVPVRYLLALESHKKEAWGPAMLSAIQPYIGNWMLFCDFLEAGSKEKTVKTDAGEQGQTYAESPVAAEMNEAPNSVEEGLKKSIEEQMTAEAADVTLEAATYNNPFFTEVIVEEVVVSAGDEAEVVEASMEEYVAIEVPTADATSEEPLIEPIHSQDYFLHQGERVSEDMPEGINELSSFDEEASTYAEEATAGEMAEEEDKSLMVMMSFSEWLSHFKHISHKQKEEAKDKKALKTMWQKEKLAAAMEEENEEIPENVFEMAVNSITKEDGLASETLAEIYIKQGKYDQAVEMYRKLSLRNPQKNVYFARKIDEVLKEKQS